MFPAEYYYPIYCIFTLLLILFKAFSGTMVAPDKGITGQIKVWLIAVFLILFIGFKPWEAGPIMGDTGYAAWYNAIKYGFLPPTFQMGTEDSINYFGELAFTIPRSYMAVNGYDVSYWFTYVAIIFIVPIIFAVKRLFPNHEYVAFLFFISGFGFYGGAMNGIRNADACSLFFLGMSFLITHKKNLLLGLFFIAFSYYHHHSVIISIVALLISIFLIKTTKKALIIWGIAIIFTLIFGNTIANYITSLGIADERASLYLSSGENNEFIATTFSHTGFRWDFLIFSAMPILLGWYVTEKLGIKDKTYQILLNTYIIANAIWILFMYAAFTNRYAALSWALIPFVLCYPVLKYNIFGKSQSTTISLFLLAQLFIGIFV